MQLLLSELTDDAFLFFAVRARPKEPTPRGPGARRPRGMRAQGQLVICGACGKALEIVTTGNVVRCSQRAARKPASPIRARGPGLGAWPGSAPFLTTHAGGLSTRAGARSRTAAPRISARRRTGPTCSLARRSSALRSPSGSRSSTRSILSF